MKLSIALLSVLFSLNASASLKCITRPVRETDAFSLLSNSYRLVFELDEKVGGNLLNHQQTSQTYASPLGLTITLHRHDGSRAIISNEPHVDFPLHTARESGMDVFKEIALEKGVDKALIGVSWNPTPIGQLVGCVGVDDNNYN